MKLYLNNKKLIKDLNIEKTEILYIKFMIFLILILLINGILKTKIKYLNNNLISDKWIVIIAFNPPTSSMITLLKIIKSWKIVIIGNIRKNDKKWKKLDLSYKYVYLSLKDQIKLGYKTTRYLNLNSYSRKNIGYLYAIQHGAKEIYEIDEDIIISNLESLEITINKTNICYGVRNDSLMINPYSHFGEKSLWPRGFRISDIGKEYNNNFFIVNSSQLILKPLIFQGLINGIPDIDSIFIQTRLKINNINSFKFSDIYPLLYFPGNYVPINSKNTKYLYDIFPFLVLPTTVNERFADILRGYIMQRFAWGYNGTIIYHSSKMYKNNSNYLYYPQFTKEKELFNKIDILIDIINNKTKDINNNKIKFINLIQYLIKKDILKKNDLKVYKAFLYDLSNFGYTYSTYFTKEINYNYKDYLKIYSELNLYIPPNPKNLILNNINNKNNIIKIINHYYSNKKYKDILLIINYNYIGLEKLNNYIFSLYNNYFNNFVFITPDNINYDNITISCNNSFNGYYSYICMKKIYIKYPSFKGYLFINDDDFMKVWELDNFDYTIPWFYTFHPIEKKWFHFNDCKPIYDIINNNLFWKQNLIKFIGYYEIPTAIADFYYLPNSVLPFFLEIIEKMYDSRVFLECAVPTSLGILLFHKYQLIYFRGLWENERKESNIYLIKEFNQITVHPIKFSNSDNKIKVNLYVYFINAKEY